MQIHEAENLLRARIAFVCGNLVLDQRFRVPGIAVRLVAALEMIFGARGARKRGQTKDAGNSKTDRPSVNARHAPCFVVRLRWG